MKDKYKKDAVEVPSAVEVVEVVGKVFINDVDVTPLINVPLSRDNLQLVKDTVSKHPDKLIKIALYVNSVPQSQLKEIFSRPVF